MKREKYHFKIMDTFIDFKIRNEGIKNFQPILEDASKCILREVNKGELILQLVHNDNRGWNLDSESLAKVENNQQEIDAKIALISKWFEDQLFDGIEIDDGESEEEDPFNPELISIETRVVPMDTLLRRLEQGTIRLNPDFQRNEVWDYTQKSRLIESLLLRIPLPMFYVSADVMSKWTVVDGLQRISALRDFVLGVNFKPDEYPSKRKNGFALSNLEFWSEYNGKTMSQLPIHLQNRIRETEFQFTVINPNTPEEVKRNIFKRLNTGGLPLSQQEIRNALYTGYATELLKKLANNPHFTEATGYSVRENRMGDKELILRLVSFLIRSPKSYIRTVTSDTWLSDTMILLNAKVDKDKSAGRMLKQSKTIVESAYVSWTNEEIELLFDKAMVRAMKMFREHAFRKSQMGQRRAPINKCLFETWGVLLCQLTDEEYQCLCVNKKQVLEEYAQLLSDDKFIISISRDSMKHASVSYRYHKINEIISKYIHL
ncbi:MAG: DUF262 domain-containing protein [Paludibacteraceae bacterium]|nr:DUF262 domain-containing protein [Paludibacteraceae bacterium]